MDVFCYGKIYVRHGCEFVKQKKISEGKNKEIGMILTFLPFAIDFEFGEQSLWNSKKAKCHRERSVEVTLMKIYEFW